MRRPAAPRGAEATKPTRLALQMMTPTKAKKGARSRGPLTPLNRSAAPSAGDEVKKLTKKLALLKERHQEKLVSLAADLQSKEAQLRQASEQNTSMQNSLINQQADTEAFESENARLRNLYNDLQSEGKGRGALYCAVCLPGPRGVPVHNRAALAVHPRRCCAAPCLWPRCCATCAPICPRGRQPAVCPAAFLVCSPDAAAFLPCTYSPDLHKAYLNKTAMVKSLSENIEELKERSVATVHNTHFDLRGVVCGGEGRGACGVCTRAKVVVVRRPELTGSS